jgi:hypothetical protein
LDRSSREGGVDRFRTTRWDIALLSAQSQAPGYKEALAELCNLYWYPLYAFVRRRGHSPEDAQDLTQGFFLDLLEHKAFTRVDQENGKFRSFLLASLRHYLDMKLALEITTQVASGLAAVHKEKLVHRDIKPTNILVRLEEGGAITAKIIDLGLAQGEVHQAGSQTAISALGGFAGTPEFASPEQFAGVGVDIRSDLYSLGVTLWEMLTGRTPFEGMPAEVMHQHLHAPLPLSHLIGIAQPAVALLEILLEKDPKQRFQSPAGLLKAMPAITDAIEKGARIARQSLQNKAAADSYAMTRSMAARVGPKKISIARLPVTGSNFFGREADIGLLDEAWANRHVNVATIVAWAGAGKSTLVNQWLLRMAAEHYRSAELVFGGPSTGRAPVGRPRPPMNFSMLLSVRD